MPSSFKFHVIAVSIICLIVTGLYYTIGPKRFTAPGSVQTGEQHIRIVSASWGLNCNPAIETAIRERKASNTATPASTTPLAPVMPDNALDTLKAACEGKLTCSLIVNNETMQSDPLVSCFKKLELAYRCHTVDRLHSLSINQATPLKINCTNPSASDAPPSAAP